MAQKSMEDVLSCLEKAFSGEIEYDEALMELNLYTAQVRKSYPHLYAALQSKGTEKPLVAVGANQLIELQRRWMEKALELLQQKSVVTPTLPQVQVSETINPEPTIEEPVYPYKQWVFEHVPNSAIHQKWNVRWDINGAPLPQAGNPLTLPRPDGNRVRFQVLSVREDEKIITLDTLIILPPAS